MGKIITFLISSLLCFHLGFSQASVCDHFATCLNKQTLKSSFDEGKVSCPFHASQKENSSQSEKKGKVCQCCVLISEKQDLMPTLTPVLWSEFFETYFLLDSLRSYSHRPLRPPIGLI